jgi:hypothetical protein
LTANKWASGNRCCGLFHAVVRLQAKQNAPRAGEGPGAGRLRRGGVALGFWRNPHGIRESVESVSDESAISNNNKNDPTGNSVHVHFDSVNLESVT